jgi:uncharacterized membrane protein
MGLETLFYTIGIVAMMLWIIIAVSCLVLVFYIRYQIKTFQNSFAGKMASLLRNRKREFFTTLGLTLGQMLIQKLKSKRGKTSESEEA